MSDNGRCVLVVEDDAEINALVGAYAQLCGFSYISALNGADGLAEAVSRHPSLIVLDLMLPDFDGFEVCTRLKKSTVTKDVPVIMLTALNSEQGRQRGKRCGAVEYITKPFDPDTLMQAITRHARGENGQQVT